MSLFDTTVANDVEPSPPELPPNESSADPMVNPLSDPIVDPVSDPLSPSMGVTDLTGTDVADGLQNTGDTPPVPDDVTALTPTEFSDFDEGTPL